MKRNATIDKKHNYSRKDVNFKVDLITEKKAILLGINKMQKKRNTN